MHNLKPNSFKLYCYLADNAQGYELDLYPCDFERIANVSYDTYKRSFAELIEKGFLIPHKERSNTFLFREESIIELVCPSDLVDTIESLKEDEFEAEAYSNFA